MSIPLGSTNVKESMLQPKNRPNTYLTDVIAYSPVTPVRSTVKCTVRARVIVVVTDKRVDSLAPILYQMMEKEIKFSSVPPRRRQFSFLLQEVGRITYNEHSPSESHNFPPVSILHIIERTCERGIYSK